MLLPLHTQQARPNLHSRRVPETANSRLSCTHANLEMPVSWGKARIQGRGLNRFDWYLSASIRGILNTNPHTIIHGAA